MSSSVVATPVLDGFFARVAHSVNAGIHTLQYARMMRALHELSDEQLATIGVARKDIPSYARECVYGFEQ